MQPLFRPPYGGVDQDVLDAVGAFGYRSTILWDVDTIDWLPVADGGDSAEEMVTKVVTTAQGGSIVLMHLGGYNTFEALPGIVGGIAGTGFDFVRVSASCRSDGRRELASLRWVPAPLARSLARLKGPRLARDPCGGNT